MKREKPKASPPKLTECCGRHEMLCECKAPSARSALYYPVELGPDAPNGLVGKLWGVPVMPLDEEPK